MPGYPCIAATPSSSISTSAQTCYGGASCRSGYCVCLNEQTLYDGRCFNRVRNG